MNRVVSRPVRTRFDLDQCLVELEHFSVDVDVIFRGTVRLGVLLTDALLHNEGERVAVLRDTLRSAEVELHAVVVVPSVHILRHKAFVLATGVLLALESVLKGLQSNPSTLPRLKVGQLIVCQWRGPVKRLMCAVEFSL